MKKIHFNLIASFVLFVLIISCQNEQKNIPANLVNNPKTALGEQSNEVSEISFTTLEHDFGRLIHGEKVSHVFKFKNTGKADLLLSKVSASCGCTASKFTKEPVKPGHEGTVEVIFDSNGQRGIQNKTVTVITNGRPQNTVLRIKAQVTTPESY